MTIESFSRKIVNVVTWNHTYCPARNTITRDELDRTLKIQLIAFQRDTVHSSDHVENALKVYMGQVNNENY